MATVCSQAAASDIIESGGLCFSRFGNGVAVTAPADGEYSGDIVVPEEIAVGGEMLWVTGVEDYAFYGSAEIRSVSFGPGVTWIGRAAMADCRNLERVSLPETLVSLGDEVFWGCSRLSEVSGGEGVSEIGSGVFRDCKSLEAYELPVELTEVAEAMFDGCSALSYVGLGSDVGRIAPLAFKDCTELATIDLPSELYEIGERAFAGAGLEGYFTVPEAVVSLGPYAFFGCGSMTGVNLPGNLMTLDEGVLAHTGIRELEIPSSVSEIGMGSVAECNALERVLLGSGMEKVGIRGFADCADLREVWVNNTLPPVTELSTFDASTYSSGTLYVPIGCKAIYAQSPNWERFGRIVETDNFDVFSGVETAAEWEQPDVRVSRGAVRINCPAGCQWRIYDASGAVAAEGRGAGECSVGSGAYIVAARGFSPVKIFVR